MTLDSCYGRKLQNQQRLVLSCVGEWHFPTHDSRLFVQYLSNSDALLRPFVSHTEAEGSIHGSFSLHVKVSLGKILNPKMLLMSVPSVCKYKCVNGQKLTCVVKVQVSIHYIYIYIYTHTHIHIYIQKHIHIHTHIYFFFF